MKVLLAAAAFILTLRDPQSCSSISKRSKVAVVDYWDGVFDDETDVLTDLLVAGETRSHSFTSIFHRKEQPSGQSNLELALVSILDALDVNEEVCSGDYVEYWWKDPKETPRTLEAHRDIDEELCRKKQVPIELGSPIKHGVQRCPTFGHVLYVNVTNVLSPTLILKEDGNGPGPPRTIESLISVPAVSNRLLRFRGDCLHAVSYPPMAFLDEDDVDHSYSASSLNSQTRRAVLLFNTWKEPPLYPPVGEALSIEESNLWNPSISCRAFDEWRRSPLVTITHQPKEDGSKSTCNDRYPLQTQTSLRIPLLGDTCRHGHNNPVLEYTVDRERIVTALTSQKEVHEVETVSAPSV